MIDEFKFGLTKLLTSHRVWADDVDDIDFVICVDHGKGAFWLIFCIISKLKRGKEPLYCNTSCEKVFNKKDSAKILDMTIMPWLTRDLKNIHNSSILLTNFPFKSKDYGAFWLIFCIIAKLKGGKEPLHCNATCAKVFCKMDSAKILDMTIMPCLTRDLKNICNSSILLTNFPFKSKENDNEFPNPSNGAIIYDLMAKTLKKFKCQKSHLVENITIYVTGDTEFLVMVLGMEGMSSHHCIHCLLRKMIGGQKIMKLELQGKLSIIVTLQTQTNQDQKEQVSRWNLTGISFILLIILFHYYIVWLE